MDKAKIIYDFLKSQIPGILVAIGYGSEFDKTDEELQLFKTDRKVDRTMRSHSLVAIPSIIDEFNWKKTENQYDYLIFVEDVKEAFLTAMSNLEECNTPTTKLFINSVDEKTITEETNVVYMTYVYVKPLQRYIKIGFCDYYGTISSMYTASSVYIPLRLSKKTFVAKSTVEFDIAMARNRKTIDFIAGLITPKDIYPLEEHFLAVYNLSYGGDRRNGIAEDPEKVKTLINRQRDYLNKNYAQAPHFERCGETVKKKIPKFWIDYLPEELQKEILKVGLANCALQTEGEKEALAKVILEYYHKRTKLESLIEPVRGLGSNGVLNSMAYLSRKLSKARK